MDLLVLSVGALADDRFRARLLEAGSNRVLLSTGAVGGLDLLRAAARLGPLHDVLLTTTKPPGSLPGPVGPASAAGDAWLAGDRPYTVFSGTAREAVARLPASVNVAATLALATVGFDATRVVVVADPAASVVRHRIEVSAAAGRYDFAFENVPSANPRTSAVTPYAVIRALTDLSARVVVGA